MSLTFRERGQTPRKLMIQQGFISALLWSGTGGENGQCGSRHEVSGHCYILSSGPGVFLAESNLFRKAKKVESECISFALDFPTMPAAIQRVLKQ